MSNWMDRKEWRDNRIRSTAKSGVFVTLGFTILWNAIAFPALFGIEDLFDEIQSKPETGLVFLFPLIGIVLIFASIKSLNNWRKFGPTPLSMDPFPGSVSGHVGGRIETKIDYDESLKYLVTLSCFYSYMSGTGKNRSRKEKVVWQTEGVCFSAPSGQGTDISFRFDVPPDLPESDAKKGTSYHLWRVGVSCELPGTDFERTFEVPVFGVQRMSENLLQATEDYHRTVDVAYEGLSDVAEIKPIAGGLDIFFPAFKRPAAGIGACIFGLIFACVGLGLAYAEDAPIIFPLVFIPIGIGVLLGGFWSLGKSLRVRIDSEHLRTRRFFLGYPITTKNVASDHIDRFEVKEGASVSNGKKTTVYYSLIAHTAIGKKIILAERLTSKPEIQLLKENIEQYMLV